ncbi:GNAT family N-acetyltransferase [Sediminibacillus dalangtanensis]|uniref:GNAT family N-acetyltransferase n=1 Tax=Sediminibacillus dalangtanensis TaxID=2729421 RepID=A0ABX7VY10_9BACI|nr:GNAT family N-acetyltransferase [Sediminibacillus dalangtanensis]QTN00945.1 GNAT family N-acetyltransferase [Sediminibacillus dalangtanensis]
MEVLQTEDVRDFFEQAASLLVAKEACNNLGLGILNRMMEKGSAAQGSAQPYLGLVKEAGKPVYVFLQTPPHNLILPDIDTSRPEIFSLIARHLYHQGIHFPGVVGPVEAVRPFGAKWEQLTGKKAEVEMKQLIYRLDEVNPLETEGGSLTLADEKEEALIKAWLVGFGKEAKVAMDEVRAGEMAKDFIASRSVYLWVVDGRPVSMANQSRKTKNGVTINAVYTPGAYKRNGYATALVAALSQKLLDDGNLFCSLYTDEANPTSNGIYQKIGYQVVGESIMYSFVKKSTLSC